MIKRNMKTIWAMMLTLLMVLSLTGCKDKENNASTDEQITEITEEVVEIKVIRYCAPGSEIISQKTKEDQIEINSYLEGKINVTVNLTDVAAEEYEEAIESALEYGNVNLFWTSKDMENIAPEGLVEQKALYDITNLLKENAAGLDAKLVESGKINGKNYFLPVASQVVEGVSLVENVSSDDKEWTAEGIENIYGISDYLDLCKGDGVKYCLLINKTPLFSDLYLDSFDFFTKDYQSDWIAVDRKTGEVVNTIQTEDYLEFVSFMSGLGDNSYVSDEEVNRKTPEDAISQGSWSFTVVKNIFNSEEFANEYGIEANVIPVTGKYVTNGPASNSCYVVSAKSSAVEAKAAVEFLNLMSNDSKLSAMFAVDSVIDTEAVDSITKGFYFDKTPVEAQYEACLKVFNDYGYALETGGVVAGDVAAMLEAYQVALDEAGYQEVFAEFKAQYENWK